MAARYLRLDTTEREKDSEIRNYPQVRIYLFNCRSSIVFYSSDFIVNKQTISDLYRLRIEQNKEELDCMISGINSDVKPKAKSAAGGIHDVTQLNDNENDIEENVGGRVCQNYCKIPRS